MRPSRAQSGQATTEYILLLVVVVAIIGGGLYQFNTAFQSFVQSYFGAYLACLLETGELPSLGGQASPLSDPGSCNSQFQAFSLANGRPLNPGASSSSSTGSGGLNSASSGANGRPNGNGNLTMMPMGGMRITFSQSPSLFAANPPGSNNGKNGKKSSDQDQIGGDAITNLEGGDNGRIIRIPLSESEGFNNWGEDDSEKEKTKILVHKAAIAKAQNPSSHTPLIKASRTIASAQKPASISGFSFSNLIRYLIIAVMIIAIVIFIGGQILQVTKSLE